MASTATPKAADETVQGVDFSAEKLPVANEEDEENFEKFA